MASKIPVYNFKDRTSRRSTHEKSRKHPPPGIEIPQTVTHDTSPTLAQLIHDTSPTLAQLTHDTSHNNNNSNNNNNNNNNTHMFSKESVRESCSLPPTLILDDNPNSTPMPPVASNSGLAMHAGNIQLVDIDSSKECPDYNQFYGSDPSILNATILIDNKDNSTFDNHTVKSNNSVDSDVEYQPSDSDLYKGAAEVKQDFTLEHEPYLTLRNSNSFQAGYPALLSNPAAIRYQNIRHNDVESLNIFPFFSDNIDSDPSLNPDLLDYNLNSSSSWSNNNSIIKQLSNISIPTKPIQVHTNSTTHTTDISYSSQHSKCPDSPDIASMSYATPGGTPSPIYSPLNTPEPTNIDYNNLEHMADATSDSQMQCQLNNLRRALEECTEQRRELVLQIKSKNETMISSDNEMKEKLNEMQAKYSELQSNNSYLRKQLDALQETDNSERKTEDSELLNAKIDISSLTNILNEYKNGKAELELELQQLKKVNIELNDNNINTSGQAEFLIENQALNQELSHRVSELDEENQSLKIELEQHCASLLQLKKDNYDFLETSKLRTSQVENLTCQLASHEATIMRLKQTNKQLATHLNEHDSAKRSAICDIEELKSNNIKLLSTITDVNEVNSKLQVEIEIRDAKLTEFQSQPSILGYMNMEVFETLKIGVDRANQEKSNLELKLTQEMQQTVLHMEAREEAENEMTKLKLEVKNLTDEMEFNNQSLELKETISGLEMDNQDLKDQLLQYQTAFDELRNTLTSVLQENKELNEHKLQNEHSMAQLTSDIVVRQDALSQAELKILQQQQHYTQISDQNHVLVQTKHFLSRIIDLEIQIIKEFSNAMQFATTDKDCISSILESLLKLCSQTTQPHTTSDDNSLALMFERLNSIIRVRRDAIHEAISDQSRLSSSYSMINEQKSLIKELQDAITSRDSEILKLSADNASLGTKINSLTCIYNKVHSDFANILPISVVTIINDCEDTNASPLNLTESESIHQSLIIESLKKCNFKLKHQQVSILGAHSALEKYHSELCSENSILRQDIQLKCQDISCLHDQKLDSEFRLNETNKLHIQQVQNLETYLQELLLKTQNEHNKFINTLTEYISTQLENSSDSNDPVNSFKVSISNLICDIQNQQHNEIITCEINFYIDFFIQSRERLIAIVIEKFSSLCIVHGKLLSLTAELSTCRKSQAEMNETLKNERTLISSIQNNSDKYVKESLDLFNKVVSLESNISNLNQNINIMRDELTDKDRIIESLKQEVEQEKVLNSVDEFSYEMNEKYRNATEQHKSLKRDYDLVDTRFKQLQITSTSLLENQKAYICELQTEITKLQSLNSQLSESEAEANRMFSSLINNQTSYLELINCESLNIQNTSQGQKNRVNSKRDALDQRNETIDKLLLELEAAQFVKQNLLNEVETQNFQLSNEMNTEMAELKLQLTSYNKENESLQSAISNEVNNTRQKFMKEVESLRNIIAGLTDRNALHMEEITEVKVQLEHANIESNRMQTDIEERSKLLTATTVAKKELEVKFQSLNQEFTTALLEVNCELPTTLNTSNGLPYLDNAILGQNNHQSSLISSMHLLVEKNRDLKAKCNELENSILDSKSESFHGNSMPCSPMYGSVIYDKKSNALRTNARENFKLVQNKNKQLDLLRIKLGYTLKELRMHKFVNQAYDIQFKELKSLLLDSGEKYQNCIDRLNEFEGIFI